MTVLISYIALMLLLVPLICSINKSIMLVPAVLAVCLLVCVCVSVIMETLSIFLYYPVKHKVLLCACYLGIVHILI